MAEALARLDAAMMATKHRLDRILTLLSEPRCVAYLDYPVHRNVGDLLILKGTERFFRMHDIRVLHRASVEDYAPEPVAALAGNTAIVLHGGGNFGDLWPRHQALRAAVIRTFPNRRVIMLPQSAHYADAAVLAEDARAFRAHPDLHLCMRDAPSAALADRFSRNVHLLPDMAHALWGDTQPATPTRREPLVLLRSDRESRAQAGRGAQDWDDLIRPQSNARFRAWNLAYRVLLRTRPPGLAPHRAWFRAADTLTDAATACFAAHPAIRTDRLHAMILACLLRRPVSFADNSYGKLGRYHEAWLSGAPSVRRVERS